MFKGETLLIYHHASFIKLVHWAGGTAQWEGTYLAHATALGSIPNTHRFSEEMHKNCDPLMLLPSNTNMLQPSKYKGIVISTHYNSVQSVALNKQIIITNSH